MTRLLILGATGLVGGQALQQALSHAAVQQVVAPSRRPLPPHPKLLNPQVDYQQLPGDAAWWQADAVLCALGTTLRQAGSRDAFREVDYGYVMAAARLARQHRTPVFVLNSSLGARLSAPSFYLKVKGEVERDLGLLGFSSLTLVRPSLLDGGPRPEPRLGEATGLCVARLLGPLLPRRIRPVSTAAVAAAMLQAALAPLPGVHAIESEQLLG